MRGCVMNGSRVEGGGGGAASIMERVAAAGKSGRTPAPDDASGESARRGSIVATSTPFTHTARTPVAVTCGRVGVERSASAAVHLCPLMPGETLAKCLQEVLVDSPYT